MKNNLKKVKAAWDSYWKDDEFDASKQHLSQADKRTLWYGAFIICICTVISCCLVLSVNHIYVSKQNEQELEEIWELIAAYIITATEDEYDKMAQTLRNDLILDHFDQEMEEVISRIPNSAENCRTCSKYLNGQAYLVCINTGELYELDLFEQDYDPNGEAAGTVAFNFGYDEISEARIQITKNPDKKDGTATIQRKRNLVSIHRMKSLFCDDCITKILNSAEPQGVGEVFFFDSENQAFYPVKAGCLQIGNYAIETSRTAGKYNLMIKYVDPSSNGKS